jgi:ABC-2 type transport system permease protein
MTALLRAESRKVLATPTIWWLLLATAAIGVVGTIAPLVAADAKASLLTDHKLQEAMHGAAAGATLVIVVAIIGLAGEWRFGQVDQTFLTTPQRWRVVAAKSLIYLGIGAVYGMVADVASTATAWAWYNAKGLTFPIDRSAVWLTLLGCLAVAVLFGLLGIAIGGITRNQVVGIVVTLGWLLIVEQALFAASTSVFKWLPGIASLAIRRMPAEGLLPIGSAFAVLAGVIVVLLAAAVWLVDRDDVTA